MDTNRKGQAFVEFVVGLFAFALVLVASFTFSDCILGSLKIQREVRAKAGVKALNLSGDDGTFASAKEHEKIQVDELSAEQFIGKDTVEVREEVFIPAMKEIIR